MHEHFAKIYDEFMKDVDYIGWYKFLRNYIKNKGNILDLGCGTGNIATLFRKDGFNVYGLDLSKEMLEIAKMKDDNIIYINKDMLEYENKNFFDYIICNFDTVNYLKSEEEFSKFLEISYNNLKKNGILIFDAVDENIIYEIFGENNLFVDSNDKYTCVWYNEKMKSTKSYQKYLISMEIFYNVGDNLYKKFEETEYKTFFDVNKLITKIKSKKFNIYDTAKNGDFGESRIFFVLTKR